MQCSALTRVLSSKTQQKQEEEQKLENWKGGVGGGEARNRSTQRREYRWRQSRQARTSAWPAFNDGLQPAKSGRPQRKPSIHSSSTMPVPQCTTSALPAASPAHPPLLAPLPAAAAAAQQARAAWARRQPGWPGRFQFRPAPAPMGRQRSGCLVRPLSEGNSSGGDGGLGGLWGVEQGLTPLSCGSFPSMHSQCHPYPPSHPCPFFRRPVAAQAHTCNHRGPALLSLPHPRGCAPPGAAPGFIPGAAKPTASITCSGQHARRDRPAKAGRHHSLPEPSRPLPPPHPRPLPARPLSRNPSSPPPSPSWRSRGCRQGRKGGRYAGVGGSVLALLERCGAGAKHM